MIDFNPRARVGRDSTNADRNAYNKISIHAPAWGATHGLHVIEERTRDFNPRARVGRDVNLVELVRRVGISIHAPAWGATWRRERRIQGSIISIHAPAWGATRRALP